jgi:hypothetical protein
VDVSAETVLTRAHKSATHPTMPECRKHTMPFGQVPAVINSNRGNWPPAVTCTLRPPPLRTTPATFSHPAVQSNQIDICIGTYTSDCW